MHHDLGLGWLTFFAQPVAAMLLRYNLIIGLSGESVIILWLLVMGVSAPSLQTMSDTRPRSSIDATTSSTLRSSTILHGGTK